MAYQALYRVWRSQTFDTIVGQTAVTQTLKNAIIAGKTSHAYLFSGPRGTGKTSAAKIFAKAINCPHNHDGEPCNECEICRSITDGSCGDVLEIDAASNNGVEEIREIRDKVKYAPTQATYKIYIIDEVHMLSTGAFNALLKTLEEPPKHVIFILATTEPHKIPATIISRTQRFDFKRIQTEQIVEHLEHILHTMDRSYEREALVTIARAAEGGMRDALSILDQALAFQEGELTQTTAVEVTGSLTHERMDQVLMACAKQETETVLQQVQALFAEGKESSRLVENLLLYCRDVVLYQQAASFYVRQSGEPSALFKELAETIEAPRFYAWIAILNEAQNEMRFTNHPDIYLEVAFLKMAGPAPRLPQVTAAVTPNASENMPLAGPEIQRLVQEVKELQAQVKQLRQNGGAGSTTDKTAPTQSKQARKPSKFRVPTERVFQVLKEATRDQLVRVKDEWEDVLQLLTVTQRAMLKSSESVAASAEGLILAFDYEIIGQRASEDQALLESLQGAYERLIQFRPEVICLPKEAWLEVRQTYIQQSKQNGTEIETLDTEDEPQINQAEVEAEAVNQAVALFGDAVEIQEN